MLNQKLSNVTAALRKQANFHDGKLRLDEHMTDILLTNLQDVANQIGHYEETNGPILVGEPSLQAIEQAVALGLVVNLADRRMARDFANPDDGGSVA
jgi:hypothetical protein